MSAKFIKIHDEFINVNCIDKVEFFFPDGKIKDNNEVYAELSYKGLSGVPEVVRYIHSKLVANDLYVQMKALANFE